MLSKKTIGRCKWVVEEEALRKWCLGWVLKDELETPWPVFGRCSRERSRSRKECGRSEELKRSVWFEPRLGGSEKESWKGNRSCKPSRDVNNSVFYPKRSEIFMILFYFLAEKWRMPPLLDIYTSERSGIWQEMRKESIIKSF